MFYPLAILCKTSTSLTIIILGQFNYCKISAGWQLHITVFNIQNNKVKSVGFSGMKAKPGCWLHKELGSLHH